MNKQYRELGTKTSLLPTRDNESGRDLGKPEVSRWLGYLAILFSLITMCMVMSLAVIGYGLSGRVSVFEAGLPEADGTPPYACIACNKLLRDPADDLTSDPLLRKLDIHETDGTEVCCAYSSEQITALFESMVRLSDPPRQSLVSYNATAFTFSPVSAHKRLYPETISRLFDVPKFERTPQVCELKADDPRYGLEHHRGVDITRQGLRIMHGGLYYIYASLNFRPQSVHPCREFKYKTFAAYVEKLSYRRSTSQIILKMVHTCCDECINTQETRFIGGVFVLEPGDVVRVKVMSYRLVHFQPETSFMGLAMLGSPTDKVSTETDSSRSAGSPIDKVST